MTTVKTCCKCKETKDVTAFPKDKGKVDGISPRCKACDKVRASKQYPRLKVSEDYKKTKRETSKNYISKYPERQEARLLARQIPLAEACEHCGDMGKLHRHHNDYSKPLEVVSLCVACHEIAHHGVIA